MGRLLLHDMHDDGVSLAMYSTTENYVLFSNGHTAPITRWLDENEMPVDSPQDAAFFEFGTDEEGYGIKEISEYDTLMPEQ